MAERKKGTLFLISASSGSGKTTLTRFLCHYFSSRYQLEQAISYTTRKPRSTEVNGVDYYFIDEKKFEELNSRGFFLEWSGAYGALYGTPIDIVDKLANGISQILIVDRAGVQAITAQIPEAVSIWLFVSDMSTLRERLAKRNSEDIATIERRLALACQEAQQEKEYPVCVYHVANDKLEQAQLRLVEIITSYVKEHNEK